MDDKFPRLKVQLDKLIIILLQVKKNIMVSYCPSGRVLLQCSNAYFYELLFAVGKCDPLNFSTSRLNKSEIKYDVF